MKEYPKTLEYEELYHSLLLSQFSELRQEIRQTFSSQISSITLSTSAIGVLLGLGIYIFIQSKTQTGLVILSVFMYIILPVISSFVAIIWMDSVFRQKRIGAYLLSLEQYLESKTNGGIYMWEQWVSTWNCKKRNISNISLYYYYACIGFYISFPLITRFVFYKISGLSVSVPDSYPDMIRISIYAGGMIYLLFILIAIFYCISIIKESRTKYQITVQNTSKPSSVLNKTCE